MHACVRGQAQGMTKPYKDSATCTNCADAYRAHAGIITHLGIVAQRIQYMHEHMHAKVYASAYASTSARVCMYMYMWRFVRA